MSTARRHRHRATAKSFTEASDCPSIRGPKTGPLLGANGFQGLEPFGPSSRLLLAAYRGSVSDFAVALAIATRSRNRRMAEDRAYVPAHPLGSAPVRTPVGSGPVRRSRRFHQALARWLQNPPTRVCGRTPHKKTKEDRMPLGRAAARPVDFETTTRRWPLHQRPHQASPHQPWLTPWRRWP